ncbi:MAG: Gfo/Idh/MocA family oxidoreductase [Magnetococcales bacterium]|nr:Gfo/Idh/MocA family oxidoreductase [Magnetococcales bacterium]
MKQSPTVAVVGAGYWGRNLVRNFHALGALRMVCDADPEALRLILTGYPDVEGALHFEEVLTEPDIAAVAIATPATAHGSMVRQALLAGKDVYVEKPLCLDAAEGEELVKLARELDRILMVGHLLWHHPAVLRLKEMTTQGELGRIQYIYSNRLNLGRLRREENVLWSFAPHDVSVILGLAGEIPERVQAQGGNYLHPRIADTTVTLLDFANGVRAHIFVSWLHPFKEQKLVVVGDRQMAVFDDTAPWSDKLLLYPHTIQWSENVPVANRAEARRVQLEESEPLKLECAHFLSCVEHRHPPRTDGAEGVRVLRVLKACQQALERNEAIRLTPTAEVRAPESSVSFVHPTAVVEEGATLGEGCKVWHFSHVMGGSRIGAGCVIGQNVAIGPKATVGDGCKIQNNVSIYQGVTLEEEVFCGPSMVFTNVLNPRAFISRKHEFRPTLVRRGATIGANATIVCGHALGRYCLIGAGAVVTGDVADHALMAGNPARRIGWVCRCAVRLDEGLTCPACGLRYRATEQGLVEVGPGEV